MAARHLTALTALGALIGCTSPPPAEVGLPEMVWIEPGEVMLGCGPNDLCDGVPVETWYEDLAGFWMDTYEVSVQAYAACVEDGVCTIRDLDGPGCNWHTPDRLDHPMNCVTDRQARAYCEWAGRRLPWWREWLRAGRGDSDDRNPWGNEPASCLRAHMSVKSPEGYLDRTGCGLETSAPVDSKPLGASRYGAQGLVGNVSEILRNEVDERGEDGEIYFRTAGTSYGTSPSLTDLRSGYQHERDSHSSAVGFRCASDDPPP